MNNETNISEKFDLFLKKNSQVPGWVLVVFGGFWLLGFVVNLVESVALFKCKRDGLLSILLHLTLADSALFIIALQEIYTTYNMSWTQSTPTCMFYLGTEALLNTLIVYLIICLNFHIITCWNLQQVEIIKNNNPLTSTSTSSECLVARNERIGQYKKRKNDIPVVFPVILSWVLSLSVSMPLYVLSSVLEVKGRGFCVVLNYHKASVNILSIVFRIVLPCSILTIALITALCKYCKRSNHVLIQIKQMNDLLKFVVILSVFYVITTYQRHVFDCMDTIDDLFSVNGDYNNCRNMYQILWHYCGGSLRGMFYYLFLKSMREVVGNLFCCVAEE